MSYNEITKGYDESGVCYTFAAVDDDGQRFERGHASLDMRHEAFDGWLDDHHISFGSDAELEMILAKRARCSFDAWHQGTPTYWEHDGHFGVSLDNGGSYIDAEDVPSSWLTGSAWDALAQAMEPKIAEAVGEEIWSEEPTAETNRQFLVEYVNRAGKLVIG